MSDGAIGVRGSEGVGLEDATRHLFAFELLVPEIGEGDAEERGGTTLRAEVGDDLEAKAATDQFEDVRRKTWRKC